jgi:WD40 repeat protein
LTLWPLDDGKPEVVLPDSTNLWARPTGWSRADRTVAFSPDGRSVVAARNSVSERGVFVLSIWDIATGHETVMPDDPEHIEHTGAISALVFSPDGRTLATASYDHSIRLWDFARRQRLATLQGHLSEVTALTFTPDGQALASGAKEGAVKWWPTRVQSKEDVIAGTWQPLAFSPDSRTLAALNRERSIVFLNLTTREAEQQFPWEAPADSGRFRFGPPSMGPGARSLAVSADLRVIVRAMDDGGIWHVNTATHETNVLKTVDGPVEVLALSPDGRLLVAGGRGRSLRWWNLRSGATAALETEAQRVLFSPEGGTLAVFQRGEAIGLWDVATWSVRTQVVADLPRGLGAAFSPDGKILATVGQDDAIQLWSTADARLLGVCTGHKQNIFSVAFTPDGRTLASTSDDSTLKFWSVANQQELLTLRRLGGAMREMLFSPDGRMLVGSRGLYSRTSGLRFYRAPSLEEIDRASHSPGGG